MTRWTIVVAALVVLTTSPASSQAAFRGDNGWLAFDSEYVDECASCGNGLSAVGMHPYRNLWGGIADGHATHPAFSADGARSAFTDHGSDDWADQPLGIAVRSLSSSDRRLGARGRARRITNGHDTMPAWSPNGRRIAFVRTTASVSDPWRHEIHVVHSDGSRLRRLGEGSAPAWSSTGQLAFERDGRIHVGSPADPAARPLVRGADPDWSPDGKQIAFEARGDIYVVRVSTRSVRRATLDRRADTDPAWSPDGRRIAFIRAHVVEPEYEGTTQDGILTIAARRGSRARLLPAVRDFCFSFADLTWNCDLANLVWQARRSPRFTG